MSAGRIRLLIVDDHGMVRRGIMAFLKNVHDIEVIGEARNGQEALQQCEQALPDVILMDILMPELGGVAATRQVRKRWPAVRVIALTNSQEKEMVQEALQAGAISYLLKNVSGDDLAEAIRDAYAGRSTLAPEAIESLIQAPAAEDRPGQDLTAREREVLALLVKGMDNPEIANRLSITRATAKAHVSNILAKLGVSNRREAIALAMRHKLVPGE